MLRVVKGPYWSLVYYRELDSLHGGFIYICVCVDFLNRVGSCKPRKMPVFFGTSEDLDNILFVILLFLT